MHACVFKSFDKYTVSAIPQFSLIAYGYTTKSGLISLATNNPTPKYSGIAS